MCKHLLGADFSAQLVNDPDTAAIVGQPSTPSSEQATLLSELVLISLTARHEQSEGECQ